MDVAILILPKIEQNVFFNIQDAGDDTDIESLSSVDNDSNDEINLSDRVKNKKKKTPAKKEQIQMAIKYIVQKISNNAKISKRWIMLRLKV